MQRIIYDLNGVLAVVIPNLDCGLTIQEIAQKDVPQGASYSIIPSSDIPDDWSFSPAWEYNEGTVSINFDKAREVTKARLRTERKPLLTALDVAFQRALEVSADTSAIVIEKQRLRDITLLPDNASTLVQLKALTATSTLV